MPTRLGADEQRPCLMLELQGELGRRVWPVHRLDFEVSGIIVYAKDPQTYKKISLAFESRRVIKQYAALTEGTAPMEKAFQWNSKLVKGKKRAFVAEHGKVSVTRAEFVKSRSIAAGTYLQWKLFPRTGRSHQLRVHLANAGFPILGDTLYGAKNTALWKAVVKDGIALRAVGLTFLDKSLKIPELKLDSGWDT